VTATIAPEVIPGSGGVTVVDPYQIAPLDELRITEQQLADAFSGWSAGDVEILPAVGIVAGGAKLEQTLLNNEGWDNFWIHVGGHLSDAWHAAGSFLFGGGSSGPSLQTVASLINLGMHVTMRGVRQLTGQIDAKRIAGDELLRRTSNYNAKVSRARAVNAHNEALHVDRNAHIREQKLQQWTDARVHNAGVAADARTDATIAALQEWTITHIAQPLSDRLDQTTVIANQARVSAHNAGIRADSLAPQLAAVAALLHQMEPQLNRVLTETEQCTEPMCEYLGPKTDWGKLLSKFGPAAIWALLAELAALHPDEVAKAAEALARGLGPVLEHFAEAWIGLLPGGTGGDVQTVEGNVGTFNPLTSL
jgi:hypothetical protein